MTELEVEFVVVGTVVKPHGIRGGLTVEPISDMLSGLQAGDRVFVGAQRRPHAIRSLQPHKQRYLVFLDQIETRAQAEALRQAELSLRFDQAQLPPGTYFHWQLVGLDVETEDGRGLGRVSEILATGANDVYVVRSGSGKELLLPAIQSVVREVDLEQGKIIVSPLPGMLSSAEND